MSAYYNEIDPFAAAWLRELVKAGAIAPGDVDERSIEDVRPDDLAGYTQCHFFAGIGVWSYALRRAGWPDDRPVWTGSCPCQPFSAAGKGAGFADERHLWPSWFHLIQERAPGVVFGEQVARATDWLLLVRSDLEGVGYAVGDLPVEAASAGAFILRDRLWFVAESSSARRPERTRNVAILRAVGADHEGKNATHASGPGLAFFIGHDGKRRPFEPGIHPLAHGAAARVGRLRGYGNAINAEAATAFIRAYQATKLIL